MTPALIGIALIATLASAALTGVMRRFAAACGVIDLPNARSSHQSPTPRAGGIGIVLTALAATAIAMLVGSVSVQSGMALIGGGAAVAVIGFLDDRRGRSARLRLLVHFGAAVWALAWLGGLPPLQFGNQVVSLGWFGYALGALGIVWVLNLFNFMDGIDGIAASEAAFVAFAAVLLSATGSEGMTVVAIVFGGASIGFLGWNWPPAKIFMGDVGSGFLGYFVAVMALVAARHDPAVVWVWLTLGAVFFVDTTTTFIRRLMRRERVYEAHRDHAYQKLSRRWRSHNRVTSAVLLVNLLWILPCAYLARGYPAYAAWLFVISMVPLVVAALAAGAGQRDRITDST